MAPADDHPDIAAGAAPSIASSASRWQRWRDRAPALTRYEPPARRESTPNTAIDPRDIQRLEAVARAQTHSYSFSPALEAEFQRYARVSGRAARISVSLLTFLLFAAAPLWTPLAFATPTQTSGFMTLLELGVMAPLFAALTVVVARYPASESAEWFLISAFLFEMLTVEVVRYFSGRAGFEIEPSIAVTVPVALLALARLRVRRCVLFVAVYFTAMLALGTIWSESLARRSATAWLMEILLLGMVLLSVVLTRLSLRRQWASSRLLGIMAYRDALTGLSNRRAFEDHYEIVTRALPHCEHGAMLFTLIDLDHFKALNDHYGHAYGDGALAEVGVALLFDCDVDGAATRAQAIVDAIRGLGIEHAAITHGTLTCSVGAALVRPGEALSDAYRRADECLYQVKRRGRDGYRLLI
jgi:GGDEF domain-containing protein